MVDVRAVDGRGANAFGRMQRGPTRRLRALGPWEVLKAGERYLLERFFAGYVAGCWAWMARRN